MSASVTLLLPPCDTPSTACRSSVTCGSTARTSHDAGIGPSSAGGVDPDASATRTSSPRSASAMTASTSPRTDRKLPRLTYTTGVSDAASQASTSASGASERTAEPRNACGPSRAVRAGGCRAAG